MPTNKTKARQIQVLNLLQEAKNQGIIHLATEDAYLDGRTVTIEGKSLLNFGSCSYLGLELDERLKQGAIQGIQKYGTQLSSSRAYLSLGLYEELEAKLEQIFRAPVLVAPSTTLGHLSNIPLLVGDNDVVIMDQQVHASVQTAVNLLRPRGIRVETIRHNRMDMLESRIQHWSDTKEKIWYMADGVYSMYGDTAPFEDLKQLADQYPQLHLYLDDAHGVSWHGDRGQGLVSEFFGTHERLYLTASMAKSFGASGGIMVYPTQEAKNLVRTCGGTMIFSGPLQPATLGAAIASVDLHLSGSLAPLQQGLLRRIRLLNGRAYLAELPLIEYAHTPIAFFEIGEPHMAIHIVNRLKELGIYTNLAVYPSVPYKKSGVRITLHNHLTVEDILTFVWTLQHEIAAMKAQAPSPELAPIPEKN